MPSAISLDPIAHAATPESQAASDKTTAGGDLLEADLLAEAGERAAGLELQWAEDVGAGVAREEEEDDDA